MTEQYPINMHVFHDALSGLLDIVKDTQTENIEKAGKLCAEAIAKGGVIQVFGSGHSVGFGYEMRDRAGNLVPVHSMMMDDFTIKGIYDSEELRKQGVILERMPDIADKLYNLYVTDPNDVFIVISNSGINGVGIDLAQYAKDTNHKVIVITSMKHTLAEDSRHPSGKKLYQLGDIVIDNCGPRGDALLETGRLEKVCSVSSITGAVIAQSISLETARQLAAMGIEPPVLWGPEKEGWQQHNEELRAKYAGRLNTYL
jgi:uncharacterized phosphosugar-binding protein